MIKLLRFQLSTPESTTYVAAVVELLKLSDETIDDQPNLNSRTIRYTSYIINPLTAEADIIIFPEGTLNNHHLPQWVPAVNDRIIPCENATYIDNPIQRISCAAKDAKKYVVINLITKRNCTEEKLVIETHHPCPSNDLILYNTNVVFDRTGCIISM